LDTTYLVSSVHHVSGNQRMDVLALLWWWVCAWLAVSGNNSIFYVMTPYGLLVVTLK
jgi:hypothetical protein